MFTELVDHLEQAKHYAELAMQECDRNGSDNPSTHVHELISILQSLKK